MSDRGAFPSGTAAAGGEQRFAAVTPIIEQLSAPDGGEDLYAGGVSNTDRTDLLNRIMLEQETSGHPDVESPRRLDPNANRLCGFASLKTKTFDKNFKDLEGLNRKNELLHFSEKYLYSNRYTPKLEALKRLVEPGRYTARGESEADWGQSQGQPHSKRRLELQDEGAERASSSSRLRVGSGSDPVPHDRPDNSSDPSQSVSSGLGSSGVGEGSQEVWNRRLGFPVGAQSARRNVVTVVPGNEVTTGSRKKRITIPKAAYERREESDEQPKKVSLGVVGNAEEEEAPGNEYGDPESWLYIIENHIEKLTNNVELCAKAIVNPNALLTQMESIRPAWMPPEIFYLYCLKPVGMDPHEFLELIQKHNLEGLKVALHKFNLVNTNAMGYVLDAEHETFRELAKLNRMHKRLANEEEIYSKILANMMENFNSQVEDLLQTTRQDLRLAAGDTYLQYGSIKNITTWQKGDAVVREKGFSHDRASKEKLKTLQRMQEVFGEGENVSCESSADEAKYIYYMKLLQDMEESERDELKQQLARDRTQALAEYSVGHSEVVAHEVQVLEPPFKPANCLAWKVVGVSCRSIIWKMYNTTECMPVIYKMRMLGGADEAAVKTLSETYAEAFSTVKKLKERLRNSKRIKFAKGFEVRADCVVERMEFFRDVPVSELIERTTQMTLSERFAHGQVIVREIAKLVNQLQGIDFVLPLKSSRVYLSAGGVRLSVGIPQALLSAEARKVLREHEKTTIASLLWGKGVEWYLPPEAKGNPAFSRDPLEVSKAHVWMIGKILYEVTCQTPISRVALDYNEVKLCEDADTRSFLLLCLCGDAKKRPALEELLRHPFMKRHKANYGGCGGARWRTGAGTLGPVGVGKVQCAVEILGDIETIVINKINRTEKGVADYEQNENYEGSLRESSGRRHPRSRRNGGLRQGGRPPLDGELQGHGRRVVLQQPRHRQRRGRAVRLPGVGGGGRWATRSELSRTNAVAEPRGAGRVQVREGERPQHRADLPAGAAGVAAGAQRQRRPLRSQRLLQGEARAAGQKRDVRRAEPGGGARRSGGGGQVAERAEAARPLLPGGGRQSQPLRGGGGQAGVAALHHGRRGGFERLLARRGDCRRDQGGLLRGGRRGRDLPRALQQRADGRRPGRRGAGADGRLHGRGRDGGVPEHRDLLQHRDAELVAEEHDTLAQLAGGAGVRAAVRHRGHGGPADRGIRRPRPAVVPDDRPDQRQAHALHAGAGCGDHRHAQRGGGAEAQRVPPALHLVDLYFSPGDAVKGAERRIAHTVAGWVRFSDLNFPLAFQHFTLGEVDIVHLLTFWNHYAEVEVPESHVRNAEVPPLLRRFIPGSVGIGQFVEQRYRELKDVLPPKTTASKLLEMANVSFAAFLLKHFSPKALMQKSAAAADDFSRRLVATIEKTNLLLLAECDDPKCSVIINRPQEETFLDLDVCGEHLVRMNKSEVLARLLIKKERYKEAMEIMARYVKDKLGSTASEEATMEIKSVCCQLASCLNMLIETSQRDSAEGNMGAMPEKEINEILNTHLPILLASYPNAALDVLTKNHAMLPFSTDEVIAMIGQHAPQGHSASNIGMRIKYLEDLVITKKRGSRHENTLLAKHYISELIAHKKAKDAKGDSVGRTLWQLLESNSDFDMAELEAALVKLDVVEASVLVHNKFNRHEAALRTLFERWDRADRLKVCEAYCLCFGDVEPLYDAVAKETPFKRFFSNFDYWMGKAGEWPLAGHHIYRVNSSDTSIDRLLLQLLVIIVDNSEGDAECVYLARDLLAKYMPLCMHHSVLNGSAIVELIPEEWNFAVLAPVFTQLQLKALHEQRTMAMKRGLTRSLRSQTARHLYKLTCVPPITIDASSACAICQEPIKIGMSIAIPPPNQKEGSQRQGPRQHRLMHEQCAKSVHDK
ncbi:Vam6/Vps39-like protein [Babesia caballi]|uniref:Vam6/Vps39-like protein n=1 Tax=Babesia caballi TaxID=5871 RepID=A0AAV4M0X4_BABCB|nr:Vam6/Vps39-like protein [Babesia caballi]